MGGMFGTIRNALKIPDLRKKMFMSMIMLLIFNLVPCTSSRS